MLRLHVYPWLCLLLLATAAPVIGAFVGVVAPAVARSSNSRVRRRRRQSHPRQFCAILNSRPRPEADAAPVLDDSIAPTDFQPLLRAASNATALRGADTSNQGHDSFRYEWGTWVVEASLQHLMEQVDTVRLRRRRDDDDTGGGTTTIYETLLLLQSGDDASDAANKEQPNTPQKPKRFRVAGGQDWDVLLHVLPEGTDYKGRWMTGAWSVVKALSGMAEICAVSSETNNNNNNKYRPRGTVKQLCGASDGSFGGGSADTPPDACVKYVGGPLRRYSGAFGKTVLLEVVIRPPIGKNEKHEIPEFSIEPLPIALQDAFFIVTKKPELDPVVVGVVDMNDDNDDESTVQDAATTLAALGSKRGMTFDAVGGLDAQLNAIARRVLASRANPAAARRLGVSHVKGILLSGPPGCGKTLLARELARILGARPPQIVNGPEILDKYIGEAEKKVRELFAPAEREYQISGDDSALHIIILDEMDAIARKRGSMTSDTTGVRDSVVNQLLAKMDGVKQASNVLVVGLTNRPELLDPALLRPGRLEVQLRVELPDLAGRRDILRIHTRQMREAGGLSQPAVDWMEDMGHDGLAAKTEHFSGAELAGLIRSAASFALAKTLEAEENSNEDGMVVVTDLEQALREVRPALGKQDEVLKMRYPLGISPYSASMKRVMRDLERFTAPLPAKSPQLQSLLVVGGGGRGGAGATALTAWAASNVSANGSADYVRFITALDLLSGGGGDAGEEARAAALVERFAEAREMSHSLLVLDDVDQLCAGSGPAGYSSVMLATLRALLRSPPSTSSTAKAGGQSESNKRPPGSGRTVNILAATSRSDAACVVLHELFDETIVVPLLQDTEAVRTLLHDCLSESIANAETMAKLMVERLGEVSCKTALRLAQRAVVSAMNAKGSQEEAQLAALEEILEDLAGDAVTAENLCEVM